MNNSEHKDKFEDISNYLQEEFELEEDEISEMLAEYMDNIQEFINTAREQVASKQFDQLAKDSHCQKGASLNIEARVMARLCKSVELAAKAADSSACIEEIATMQLNLDALKADFPNA